jgi:TIR domain
MVGSDVGAAKMRVQPCLPVFISYRREDTGPFAGRIKDRLAERFGNEQVFLDVDSIALGRNFGDALSERLEECRVFLALIGRRWLTAVDNRNRRRLDDPGDFVRIEMEGAFKRKIPVIPILIENASMPKREELPASLRELPMRQWIKFSHEGFDAEIGNLIGRLMELSEEDFTAQLAARPRYLENLPRHFLTRLMSTVRLMLTVRLW